MLPIKDINRPSKTPIVTRILVILNIIIFFYTYLRPREIFLNIIWTFGIKPYYIIHGQQLYTLLTSMFLHGDLHHIFGNMIYLWIFGDNVEDRLGHIKFLIFYISAGIMSGIIQTVITPNSTIPMIGASGAISGILGIYIVLFPWAKIHTFIFSLFIWIVEIPAYYYLGFWFLLQLLYGFVSLRGIPLPVAYWAHISGFVYGFIIATIFKDKLLRKENEEYYVIWI